MFLIEDESYDVHRAKKGERGCVREKEREIKRGGKTQREIERKKGR